MDKEYEQTTHKPHRNKEAEIKLESPLVTAISKNIDVLIMPHIEETVVRLGNEPCRSCGSGKPSLKSSKSVNRSL